MAKVDLKRLGDLSDADLWEKLGTNEVPWFNGADELHKRLLHQRDQVAEITRERDRINRDAERHARRAEQLEVERDQVIAQRDALKAQVAWANGELSRIWKALS